MVEPDPSPNGTGFLDSQLGFQLRCAQMAVFRDIRGAFSGIDVTIAQYSAMTIIDEAPGISQAELALAMEVERPRIVPVLNRLQERGWTVRLKAAHDRRIHRLHLTTAGQAALTELNLRYADHQARMNKLLRGIDVDQFMAGLRLLSGR